jgi:hypothetical protein
MSKIWILRGALDAEGWNVLRKDYKDEKIDIIHLDAKVWAIVNADKAPTGYEGLQASEPADGMYLDPNGSPLYLVGGEIVATPEELVAGLGEQAQAMMEKTGDALTALERIGRVY